MRVALWNHCHMSALHVATAQIHSFWRAHFFHTSTRTSKVLVRVPVPVQTVYKYRDTGSLLLISGDFLNFCLSSVAPDCDQLRRRWRGRLRHHRYTIPFLRRYRAAAGSARPLRYYHLMHDSSFIHDYRLPRDPSTSTTFPDRRNCPPRARFFYKAV